MKANLMITATDSGPVFGWFNTSSASLQRFEQCADQFTSHTTVVLHLRIQGEATQEQKTEVLRNYMALLSKSWRFLFPTTEGPTNPWISGFDMNYELLGPWPGAMRIQFEEGFVEIRLGRQTPKLLTSLVWRLSNAFEWCMIPYRRRLSGRAQLSRETWDAISVYQDGQVLRREARPESRAELAESPASEEAPPAPQTVTTVTSDEDP